MNECVFTLMSYQEKLAQHKDLQALNRIYQGEYGVSFFDVDESVENQYLVCHHDIYGVIGAAKISPPSSKKSILNDYFKHNNHEIKNFWQVSHILFAVTDNDAFHEEEDAFEILCQTFYKKLSKTLALIGLERDIQTWVILNGLDDHEDSKYFGKWSYSIEHCLLPENNLIFGCLENKKLISLR